MGQSGAPWCDGRRIDVAHAGVEKCTLQCDVFPGRGFSLENIEFPVFWEKTTFQTLLGGPGATKLLLGGPRHPFTPLMELSWHVF